ncbi:hypothetical protein IPN35_01895 [Candidatus Peregrinibacteria bacterium]|nr:MAG: hypothetical protein IPN35_01895 [Candidatus Peregrinibacteria bacterium]
MFYAIDLGGSTVDILQFEESGVFYPIASIDSQKTDKSDLSQIFFDANTTPEGATKIVLTGGHNRLFHTNWKGIPLQKISEIDAIGAGGMFLAKKSFGLICSLGTGTCCVSATKNTYQHVGGTGIGGGTFLGLSEAILGIRDFEVLKEMVSQGDPEKIDLLVEEIVGGGIGVVPGNATASNFAKAKQGTRPEDLARGIANIVGQTIASIAVFAARAEKHKDIILGGKLIFLPEIIETVKRTANIYGQKILIPNHAEYLSAIGAGVLAQGLFPR